MPTVIGMPKGDIPFSSFGGARLCTNKLWKYFILSAVRCQMFFAISSSCIISPWNTSPACALPPRSLTTAAQKTQNPSVLLSKCLFLHFSPLHLHYPADESRRCIFLHFSPPTEDIHQTRALFTHPHLCRSHISRPILPRGRPETTFRRFRPVENTQTPPPGRLYIYIIEGRPR